MGSKCDSTNLSIHVICEGEADPFNDVEGDDADEPREFFALNEVAVTRGANGRIIDFGLDVSGSHLATMRGDGLVVASATGSTAYALSAGGPIIAPRSNCIEVVPVAAHTLGIRPTIFRSSAHITVTPILEEGRDALLLADGTAGFLLAPGDVVHIRKDSAQVLVVRMKPDSFYETVRDKLQEGESQ